LKFGENIVDYVLETKEIRFRHKMKSKYLNYSINAHILADELSTTFITKDIFKLNIIHIGNYSGW